FDYLWEENYAAAVRYHREHGDLNVPVRYVDSEGIRLGQWVNGIRSNRNRTDRKVKPLTDEQIARLDSLGMIWESKYEKQWNDAFQALCDYYKMNCTFEIPVAYQTDSGIKLGAWIRHQRDEYEKGKLSEERIKKLKVIGFTLEKSDPWEEKYQLAKAYFEEHGDLNVPAQYVVNGVWLHKWLNEQKLMAEGKRKKKLTSEQLARLEAIGLRYGSTYNEKVWNERFEMAKIYFEEHGDLNVTKDYTVGDFQLGIWLRQQKSQYKSGNIPTEHYERLSAIGMDWNDAAEKRIKNSYEQGFQHLEAFLTDHSVDSIMNSTVCDDGYRLGNWIANCKTKYHKGTICNCYG
ncbi:MAG: helicase associated domain-containing protein, partial [Lachnospiraceae bacterium]|nr:helicase associated domain-containing protein [Lachnospiraceae bacterium]